MKLQHILESIDLLIESPESIGLPKYIGDQIRELVDYRKAQDYLAIYFKNWDAKSNKRARSLVGKIGKYIGRMRDEAIEALAERLGIAYEWKKRNNGEEPPMEQWKNIVAGHLRIATEVEQLLNIRKKVKKLAKEEHGAKRYLEWVDQTLSDIFYHFSQEYSTLIKFLNTGPNAYRKLKGLDLQQAKKLAAINYVKIDPSRIVYEFPDGYFWYELKGKRECELEGEIMQHCGEIGRNKKMYTLKDERNESHVTVDYSKRDNTIAQIRGKQNTTPVKKYWPYIDNLLRELPSKKIMFSDAEAVDKEAPWHEEFQKYMASLDSVIIAGGNVQESAVKAVEEEGENNRNNRTSLEAVYVEDTGLAGVKQMVCWLAYVLSLDEVDEDIRERRSFPDVLVSREKQLVEAMNDNWLKHKPLSLTSGKWGFEMFWVEEIDLRDNEIVVVAKVDMNNESLQYDQNIIDLASDMEVLLSEDARDKVAKLLSKELREM